MMVCWCLIVCGTAVYGVRKATSSGPVGQIREKSRVIHALLGGFALLAGIVGYLCIFKNHLLQNQSQFGFDAGNPTAKTVHALVGYVVLAWMLLQSLQGLSKLTALQKAKLTNLKHPLSGRLLLLLM